MAPQAPEPPRGRLARHGLVPVRLLASWYEPKDLPAGKLPEFLSVLYGK